MGEAGVNVTRSWCCDFDRHYANLGPNATVDLLTILAIRCDVIMLVQPSIRPILDPSDNRKGLVGCARIFFVRLLIQHGRPQ